MPHAPNHF
jgi:hypothetical protein